MKYKIVKHITTISEKNGYSKEINLVSWNGKEPICDIRKWKMDEGRKEPLKGITITKDELPFVVDKLQNLIERK